MQLSTDLDVILSRGHLQGKGRNHQREFGRRLNVTAGPATSAKRDTKPVFCRNPNLSSAVQWDSNRGNDELLTMPLRDLVRYWDIMARKETADSGESDNDEFLDADDQDLLRVTRAEIIKIDHNGCPVVRDDATSSAEVKSRSRNLIAAAHSRHLASSSLPSAEKQSSDDTDRSARESALDWL